MATDEKAVVSAGSSPTGFTSAPTIKVPPRLMAAGAVVGLAAWVGAAVGGTAGAWVAAGGAGAGAPLVAAGSERGGVGEQAANARAIPPSPSHRNASRRLSRCPAALLSGPVRCAVRVIVEPSPGAAISSNQNRAR